jgi:hypothetical protein
MEEACSTNREKRNAYRLMVERPEGKRLLGRPRRKWMDNIRMDLGEVGWCLSSLRIYRIRIGQSERLRVFFFFA